MFQEMANDLRGIKEALGPSGIRKIFLAPFLVKLSSEAAG